MHRLRGNLYLDLRCVWKFPVRSEARNHMSLITSIVNLGLAKNLILERFADALFALAETRDPDSQGAPRLTPHARSRLLSRVNTHSKSDKQHFLHGAKLVIAFRTARNRPPLDIGRR